MPGSAIKGKIGHDLTHYATKLKSVPGKSRRNTDVRQGNNAGTTQSTTSTKVTEAKQKKNEFIYANNCFSTKGTDTNYGGNGLSSYTITTNYETTCELK